MWRWVYAKVHVFNKLKMMCLLWAQRVNQLSRHLIDTGQSNLFGLIRMLYSYQTNLFLAITVVYGNWGMFWSSLSMRPPAPADELVSVNCVSKEFVLSFCIEIYWKRALGMLEITITHVAWVFLVWQALEILSYKTTLLTIF